MLRKVYNNVEGHRVLDGGQVCEDITSISLPTLSNTTSTIKASGMAMDVDVPDTTHMEAAEIGISHNNGVNCKLLAAPGKHSLEARVVRQRYNVQAGGAAQEHREGHHRDRQPLRQHGKILRTALRGDRGRGDGYADRCHGGDHHGKRRELHGPGGESAEMRKAQTYALLKIDS